MEKINVCFVLSSDTSENEGFEHQYQSVYKPTLSFLYDHPECKLSFAIGGVQLLWYKKKRPEFLSLLGQMACNKHKQVEVLGGGFYDPIFPLLNPSDRSGQIELLSSQIRQEIGVCPRGMTLRESCWDTSLVSGFQTCGMKYVLLESSLIPQSKRFHYLPIVATEKGKTINVLPYYDALLPSENVAPEEYLHNIISVVSKAAKNDNYSRYRPKRVAVVLFDHVSFALTLNSGWLSSLVNAVQTKFRDALSLTHPLEVIENAKQHVQGYIPAGISKDVSKWTLSPYTASKTSENIQSTIYDFFEAYPVYRSLYNRMFYVSLLLDKCRGDKIRKKAAREKLWEAQDGRAFVCLSSGIFSNAAWRKRAFHNLTEAEKIVRDSSPFQQSITNFDYNGDGMYEYVCQMEQYDAVIGLQGGSIFEFDVIKNACNYTDNLSCIEQFEGYSDNYARGMFIDHLFSDSEFKKYANGAQCSSGVFSQSQYNQIAFNHKRHEIQLCATDTYLPMNLPVSLRKNYLMNTSSITVQYILKNDSPFSLDGKLAVEFNFSQTDLSKIYEQEIVTSGKRIEFSAYTEERHIISDVSVVQITDSENNMLFILEPNENCGTVSAAIPFFRPDNQYKSVPVGMACITTLFWNVHLSAGMEVEKTITFSILVPKHKSAK